MHYDRIVLADFKRNIAIYKKKIKNAYGPDS